MIEHARCENCSLYDACSFRPVFGHTYGDKNKVQIIFVAEAPGENEYYEGIPLVGSSGKLLNSLLAGNGLRREDVYCTNTVLCHPENNRNPNTVEIASCNERLKQEILSIPNRKIIVCLGSVALQALSGNSKAAITKKMFSIDYSEYYGCYMLYAYHPAAILRQTNLLEDLQSVIQQVKSVVDGKIKKYNEPRVVIEDDWSTCVQRLQHIQENFSLIASDLETDYLDFTEAPILSIGMCWQDDLAYIIPAMIAWHPEVRTRLKNLYEDRKIKWIWHNGIFDVKFLRHNSIDAQIDEDTILLHAQLDERSESDNEDSSFSGGKIHGLKVLGRKYLGTPDWSSVLDQYKTNKDMPFHKYPEETLYTYQGYDCDVTFKLYKLFKVLIEEDYAREPSPNGYPCALNVYNNILIPAANALANIERHGVKVDVEYNRKLDKELSIEIIRKEEEVIDYLNEKLPHKKYVIEAEKPKLIKQQKADGFTPINVSSPKQLAQLLYDDMGFVGASRSTDKAALDYLEKQGCTFVKHLRDYRVLTKRHGTYVKGLFNRLDADGVVHSNFLLIGAITGRLSSRNPNLQNILRDNHIKKQFIARDGYIFVSSDYEQLEVRVAAYLTRDANLIAAVRKDIHTTNCEIVFSDYLNEIRDYNHKELLSFIGSTHLLRDLAVLQKMHPEEFQDVEAFKYKIKKELRQVSKPITFGVIYGLQPYTLATRDLHCPVDDAEKYIERLLGQYSVLRKWIEKQHKLVDDVGIIDQPTGRRRRFPLTTAQNINTLHNMSVNSPIQGFASDFNTVAIAQLEREFAQRKIGYPLFPVHDNTNAEILEAHIAEGVALIKYTMENVITDEEIQFPVEIKIGSSWGDCKKVSDELIQEGYKKLGFH